jgi:polyferredoxin
MLGDADTRLVRYSDPKGDCIGPQKCVRACPMGIDIRESPFQIECVRCAECIDACKEVLVRLGAVGIALAVTGALNPILAAGAMALSSLSVIANSRRLA